MAISAAQAVLGLSFFASVFVLAWLVWAASRTPESGKEQVAQTVAAIVSGPAEEAVDALGAYHAEGLHQARSSFVAALVAAALGFVLVAFACWRAIFSSASVFDAATIVPVVSAAVVETVAGLFFVQSNKARELLERLLGSLHKERRFREALRFAEQSHLPAVQAVLALRLADAGVEGETVRIVAQQAASAAQAYLPAEAAVAEASWDARRTRHAAYSAKKWAAEAAQRAAQAKTRAAQAEREGAPEAERTGQKAARARSAAADAAEAAALAREAVRAADEAVAGAQDAAAQVRRHEREARAYAYHAKAARRRAELAAAGSDNQAEVAATHNVWIDLPGGDDAPPAAWPRPTESPAGPGPTG